MENLESENTGESNYNAELAFRFKELLNNDSGKESALEGLEHTLRENDFELADSNSVHEILGSQSLMARSENFTRVLDLLTNKTPIFLENGEDQANMCKMVSGDGFKVAMTEGFSGNDVGGVVKTVISFRGDHIDNTDTIDPENDLWRTKPETAKVSVAGSGSIYPEDIEMVSFRFPIRMFPEDMLTEEEKDKLEDHDIKFVVRHYIGTKEKTVH